MSDFNGYSSPLQMWPTHKGWYYFQTAMPAINEKLRKKLRFRKVADAFNPRAWTYSVAFARLENAKTALAKISGFHPILNKATGIWEAQGEPFVTRKSAPVSAALKSPKCG